ncbi:hypothetical protein DdX_17910 [Ditylenchus destructor]|uniref:Uncharacterized protein n=1 Tax=Ditylenchus destructor TaxID=166010 RepID=A0AAD4QVC7_9BILA|nr:hypothetical protein DdX_17910 [Ditylenchus destructor]
MAKFETSISLYFKQFPCLQFSTLFSDQTFDNNGYDYYAQRIWQIYWPYANCCTWNKSPQWLPEPFDAEYSTKPGKTSGKDRAQRNSAKYGNGAIYSQTN